MFGLNKPKVITDEKKIDELLTRGVENVFPSMDFVKSKLMRGERISVYLGIDPTGPTLHLGHVIPLKKLAKFQELGHQIILLMGDFTAMIGDPTDKTAVRKKLSREEVLNNLKDYKKQASKFISFDGPNPALFKFNSEWLGKMKFSDVLELASLATVEQMMKRDMFQRRIQDGKPIYVHEFMYPLMHGFDCVPMDVDGEIGGNDQTFNMLVGRDLMKALKNKEKFVITTKLLVDSSGGKMGKTEGNMVALNQSPEDMFGRVMSWNDELIIPAFEVATDLPLNEIKEMSDKLMGGANPKEIKAKLAKEIVKMYHGEKSAEKARQNFDKTFAKGEIPDEVLEVNATPGSLLVDVLMNHGLVSSRSEFARLILENAVAKKSSGGDIKIVNGKAPALDGVYRIGKKRFVKINLKI